MAPWIEIRATGPAGSKDLASALLISLGSPGVEEEAPQTAAGSLVSHSLWEDETREDDDASLVRVIKGYLPAGQPAAIEKARARLATIGWAVETSLLKDTDWSEKWKKGLRPIRVGRGGTRLVVKPTWHRVKRARGEKVIDIDPGMAFGTGGHATTKMCLKAVLRLSGPGRLPKGPTMLDVGTGTGVLAIAAMKLGFTKALGTEIDRVALKVARGNARANGVKIRLSAKDLPMVQGRYDLVVANILAGELKRLSKALFSKMRPGGFLVLSGILDAESSSVGETFTTLGLTKAFSLSEKGWVALAFRRAAL